MARFIDADMLINEFSGGESMKSISESIADARFVEIIKKAPTADVQKIINCQQAEIERLNAELQARRSAATSLKANFGIGLVKEEKFKETVINMYFEGYSKRCVIKMVKDIYQRYEGHGYI